MSIRSDNAGRGRKTGATLAMVNRLPETGSIVVAQSGPMRAYLTRMIRDVRGPLVASRTRVVWVGTMAAADRHLLGYLHPAFIDRAFYANGMVEARVRALAQACNDRFAAATEARANETGTATG